MQSLVKKPLFCIVGPTGSGKSALALALATYFPIEIISVDASMLYRGLNIGTAKPSSEELAICPHHLIDCLDPSETYSVMQFLQDSSNLISAIEARQHIPVLVGGTMMYFNALQKGISAFPSIDKAIRLELMQRYDRLGLGELYQELVTVDPDYGRRLKPQDSQRILRALEVYYQTKQPFSSFLGERVKPLNHDLIFLGLMLPRAILHQCLETRFHRMLEQGLIEEVQALYARKELNPDLPALRAVGYRQVWQYLAGELSYEEMVTRAIIATRQLAKRQMTWLRSFPNIIWFDVLNPDLVKEVCDYLNNLSPCLC